MPEVLLVNPRRRPKSTRKRRPTRSRKPRSTRRRNPVAAANPRRRPRRRSPARRRSYRRNPAARFNLTNFMQDTLMPSAMGAAGALGVDLVMGVMPLPANLKTGPMRPLVKGLGAVALGFATSFFARRKTAEMVTAGALTVVLYDTAKTFMQQQFPQIPLGEYDQIEFLSPAAIATDDAMGAYMEEELGAYLEDDSEDMEGVGNIDEELGDLDEELGEYIEADEYD